MNGTQEKQKIMNKLINKKILIPLIKSQPSHTIKQNPQTKHLKAQKKIRKPFTLLKISPQEKTK